jgi:hypothetical protein
MIEMHCTHCGLHVECEGRPAELQQLVAIEMGHPMPTLGLAVAHIMCPRCDESALKLLAGSYPAQAQPSDAARASRPESAPPGAPSPL